MTQPPYGDQPQPPGQPSWPPPAQPATWPPPAAPTEPVPLADPTPPTQPVPAPPESTQPTQPPPRKRRGVLVTAIVLGAALLLCAGGGTAAWLLLRNADGTGAQSPTVAVNDFLVAVYSEGDVSKATGLVCREARKRADIQRKVDQLKEYGKQHKEPRFSWSDPKVSDAQADRATVDVTVRVTTSDERIAQESLHITVVRKTGWFVCEVQSR